MHDFPTVTVKKGLTLPEILAFPLTAGASGREAARAGRRITFE
jgi:hypothetical protein